MPETIQLPELILLETFGGNPTKYFEAVYEVFKRDFVKSKPIYRGRRLGLKKHPQVDGKEATFYHLTHSGDIHSDRIPDMRRMERIPFPKPIIDNSNLSPLKVWMNKRRSENRICLLHEDESYLVVLADRGDYILPWTAYYIEYENRKIKLLREYEQFIKAEAAS